MTLSPSKRVRGIPGIISLIAICTTASCVQAHETSWARPAHGRVLAIDRISDTIIFLPNKGSNEPWLMDLESAARYYENGKLASSLALKPGTCVEVFYRTPIFGNRFIDKIVWNRDDVPSSIAAGARDPGVVATTGPKTNMISVLWTAIHLQFEGLSTSVETKQLAAIPAVTAQIRDLTTALSKTLPAHRNHRRLANRVAHVRHWTCRIESAAAKGDSAGVEAGYKKLKKALQALVSLYPSEVLKASMVANTGWLRGCRLKQPCEKAAKCGCGPCS